jgi:hypothetical protein
MAAEDLILHLYPAILVKTYTHQIFTKPIHLKDAMTLNPA